MDESSGMRRVKRAGRLRDDARHDADGKGQRNAVARTQGVAERAARRVSHDERGAGGSLDNTVIGDDVRVLQVSRCLCLAHQFSHRGLIGAPIDYFERYAFRVALCCRALCQLREVHLPGAAPTQASQQPIRPKGSAFQSHA